MMDPLDVTKILFEGVANSLTKGRDLGLGASAEDAARDVRRLAEAALEAWAGNESGGFSLGFLEPTGFHLSICHLPNHGCLCQNWTMKWISWRLPYLPMSLHVCLKTCKGLARKQDQLLGAPQQSWSCTC